MDGHCVVAGLIGCFAGWTLRGYFPDPREPVPCNCNCACHHQLSHTPSSWGPNSGFLTAIVIVCITVLANLALVFKVSWVSRGDESELALVVSQKGQGKSKGIFNSSRGLQIQG